MKELKTILVLIVVLLLNACSGPMTIEDSGKTINLSMDDPFEVVLRSNGSTGYQWVILPYDSSVIEQVGQPEFVADDDRIGSGGDLTFRFKTVGEGSTRLIMIYKRKWEDPDPDNKTFELEIVCGTMGRILEE